MNNIARYVIILYMTQFEPINNLKGGIVLENIFYSYLFLLVSIGLMLGFIGMSGNKVNYPKGKELLNELQKIGIQGVNLCTFNMELIDPYIFRHYVYRYEMIGGHSREVALRMAFEEYKRNYIK